MSKHRTRQFKLLTLCIVFVQILALTTTGMLTALGVPAGPTPHLAQSAAHTLPLPGAPWAWLADSRGPLGRGLAWGARQLFGTPKTALAQGGYPA
ncbi:MAG: hypothetical protein DCC55_23750 [Chloroflexi bacterium]|nr:MAG: hypothetical protein DCC55_23750 [Chloroflexota bacterium]